MGNNRKVFFSTLVFTLIATLLAGCSGHPGAGKWVAISASGTTYSHINVEFDGKATILPVDKQSPQQNCYWQASAADTIGIQCGTSEKDQGAIFYTLTVTEPTLATLKKDDKVVGEYKRVP